jgi:hypothetical protein
MSISCFLPDRLQVTGVGCVGILCGRGGLAQLVSCQITKCETLIPMACALHFGARRVYMHVCCANHHMRIALWWRTDATHYIHGSTKPDDSKLDLTATQIPTRTPWISPGALRMEQRPQTEESSSQTGPSSLETGTMDVVLRVQGAYYVCRCLLSDHLAAIHMISDTFLAS